MGKKDNRKIIATLGPEGTFSHQVAEIIKNYMEEQQIETDIAFESTLSKVFRTTKDNYDLAVVPLENSYAGSVGDTMDHLIRYNRYGINIIGEIDLDIHHNLTGFGTLKTIKKLYTHPLSYSQCEHFIDKYLPDVEIINTSSNSKSAQMINQIKSDEVAAIAPKIATEIYNLPILNKNIEDASNNITRFVIITKEQDIQDLFAPAQKTKSAIVLDPHDDHPGLLYEILGVFAQNSINLTKIESRPSKRTLGDYKFYIELQGDISDMVAEKYTKELKELAELTILGSYPHLDNIKKNHRNKTLKPL